MTGSRFMVGRLDVDGKWRSIADLRTGHDVATAIAQLLANHYRRPTAVTSGVRFAAAIKHEGRTYRLQPHPEPNPPLWRLQSEGGTAVALVHGTQSLARRVAQRIANQRGQRVEVLPARSSTIVNGAQLLTNPRATTIAGAVAAVVHAAGFHRVAADVRAGIVKPETALRFALIAEDRAAMREKLQRALDLVLSTTRANPRKAGSAAAAAAAAPRLSVAGAPARRGRGRASMPKRNPAPRPRELDRARAVFRQWHGFDAERVDAVPFDARGAAAYLGEVTSVTYKSDKWTGKVEHYKHGTKSPRPWLCVLPDRRTFVLVGGGMRATARGLVG